MSDRSGAVDERSEEGGLGREPYEVLRIQRDLAVALSAMPSLEVGFRLGLQAAIEASSMDGGAIYVFEDSKGKPVLKHATGLPETFINQVKTIPNKSPIRQLGMEEHPVYSNYSKILPLLRKEVPDVGLRAVAMVPIVHAGRAIGVLSLGSFTMDEVPRQNRYALESIARQLGSAIQAIQVAEAEKAQTEERLLSAQKLEAVGNLARGIAHDFNNLLTVILSASEAALATLEPTSPLRDDLNEILEAARRAATLAQRLLAFGRRQSSHPPKFESDMTSDQALPRGTETILVIEDDSGVRRNVVRMLKMFGYSVIEASEGLEALRLASEHTGSIDLIVTDIVMPGLSGPEVVRKLGENCARKVLYMSGYPDRAVASRGVFTSQNFLQKPFRHEALVKKVRQVLDT